MVETPNAYPLIFRAIGYPFTVTGNAASCLEFVGCEVVAPYAAAIERNGFGVIGHALERGPMPKQNRLAFCKPALMAKPRQNLLAGDRVGNGLRALTDEIQLALASAVAHAGEVVGNHP